MRVSEALAAIYFIYLALTAVVVPLPRSRRLRVWIAAALVLASEILVSRLSTTPTLEQVRDWLPAFVILLAYFATGWFFVAPSARAEAWLQRWDDRLIGGWHLDRVPRLFRLYFDLVYDVCFLIIPAGFAVLAWTGLSALADRYWTLVSAAEFLSFGTLPWFQARPPWVVETDRPIDRAIVRRFSLAWVSYTTIRANTFPSGHASASLVAALALWPEAPWGVALFAVLAFSIAIGSVVGRFHYAIDAITGLLLAVALRAAMAVAR